MWGRLKQMLIKEVIQVFRDKRTRFLLFGPPIIQMLMFGYAATFEIYHVPTVVLDLDHSQESRELLSRFSSSPYFNVQRQLTDDRQVGDLIEQGKATIGLEIHAGFAQNLRKGQTAPLQVIVDATNSNTALIASAYITQIALGFAQDYQKDRIYRIAPQMVGAIPSVRLEQRPWYNPDLRSRWFFVPGIIGSLTLVLVVTLTAFAVVREREIGTLEQIMVTPIRPFEFILGKTLPFFLIGLFDVSLIATVGTFWFEVPFRGNILVHVRGSDSFSALDAGGGLADFDRLGNSAAGDGDLVLLYYAGRDVFRLCVSHQHYANVAAIPHLSQPAALLSGGASRHLSERRRDGNSLAPDVGHGCPGNCLAHDRCVAIPQGARLSARDLENLPHCKLKSLGLASTPEGIMGIVENIKDAADLAKKIGDIELYRKIVHLEGEVMDLTRDKRQADQKIEELQGKLALQGQMTFRQPFYFQDSDEVPVLPQVFRKGQDCGSSFP